MLWCVDTGCHDAVMWIDGTTSQRFMDSVLPNDAYSISYAVEQLLASEVALMLRRG